MSYRVKRTRIEDTSTACAMGFREPEIGKVAYSKPFRTAKQAEREAAAWRSTGDWDAEVFEHSGRI
jgi:hypothetical protein